MSKPVKDMIARELESRYGALDSALWVELTGVNGTTTTELRRELHSRRISLEIVKNAIFRRAVSGKPLARLAEEITGPAALVTGGDSLIEAAKVIESWLPKAKGLKLRAAVLEGEFIAPSRIDQLAKMPTKRDLQARVAGVIRSPGANLAAAILSGGGRIAACIKALTEKLEKGETVAATA